MMSDDQRKLVEDNINLCYWMSHKYMKKYGESFLARIGMNFDDVVSVGFSALCDAAMKFDPKKGAFATLYGWAFFNDMKIVMRKAHASPQRVMTDSVSYDALMNDDGKAFEELMGGTEDVYFRKSDEEIIADIRDATRVLSNHELYIMDAMCHKNKTQKQIAADLKCSQPHVSRKFVKAKSKLAEELRGMGYHV